MQAAARVPPDHPLCRLAAAVAWAGIETALAGLYPSPLGRPSHPPLMLFKALLLRRWYGLSDPGLEAGLKDRLSWQNFCGLGIADPVPDETTFCRFRARLRRNGLAESLFRQVEAQIRGANLPLPHSK